MGSIIVPSIVGLGWLALNYFMEPFFPLGDYRWLILAILLFGSAGLVWYRDNYKYPVLLVVALVFVVGAIFSSTNVDNNKTHDPAQTDVMKPTGEKPGTPTQRIYTPRTPAELSALVKKEYTELQAEHITKPHTGTWMRLSGKVEDIKKIGGDPVIYVALPSKGEPAIGCQINEKWIPRIRVLGKGDRVNFTGKINRIYRGYISLDDCEIENLPSLK